MAVTRTFECRLRTSFGLSWSPGYGPFVCRMMLAYVNADHWALAVPVARTHPTIGALFVTQNAYPREALVEAILRFVEEDRAEPNR